MGFLDSIMGKKKLSEEEMQAKEDMEMVSSEEKYKSYVQDQSVSQGADGMLSSSKVAIDVDKLKAQVEALKDMRAVYDERFTKLNQDVGEAKAMILNTEKDMQDTKQKAEVASALVLTVQPENLMKDVKLLEAKLGENRAYIEKIESYQAKMNDEMRELRGKLGVFRGLDAVKELADEVKKDLYALKKTLTTIEAHADKVGYIYLDFQKKFANLDQVFTSVGELREELARLAKDISLVKVKSGEYANKVDLTTLRDDIKVKMEALDTYLKTLDQLHNEIDDYVDKKLDVEKRSLNEMMAYIQSYAKDIEKYQSTVSETIKDAKSRLLEELEKYQVDSTKLHGELKLKFGQAHEGLIKETTEMRTELDELRVKAGRQADRQEMLNYQRDIANRIIKFEEAVSKMSLITESIDFRIDRVASERLREALRGYQKESSADISGAVRRVGDVEKSVKAIYSLLGNMPTKDDFSALMDRYTSINKFERNLRDMKSNIQLIDKQVQLSEDKLRRYVDAHYGELAGKPPRQQQAENARSED